MRYLGRYQTGYPNVIFSKKPCCIRAGDEYNRITMSAWADLSLSVGRTGLHRISGEATSHASPFQGTASVTKRG